MADAGAGSLVQPMRRERAWLLAFVAFAALRVLASAAVFPFFDNVDESAHFDLVVKWSRLEPPRGLAPFSRESLREIARWGSPEYLARRDLGGAPLDPSSAAFAATLEAWGQEPNPESGEPPLYYAIAGLWLALGRGIGLEGVTLLFWLRALNALPAAGLVWLGFVTARAVFPESRVQRLGVPLLLAVIPQDSFWSIGADVLSPLCFGAAFLGVVRFGTSGPRPHARVAVTGLALAGSVLAKVANAPFVGVALVELAARARRVTRRRPLQTVAPSLALLTVCAALPFAAWLAWNRARFGDWTGTAAKVARLDWTPKPLTEWLPHPLFTLEGAGHFWSETLASFWRGEFTWHLERLAHAPLDAFYWGSSLVLPLVALARLPESRDSRAALLFAAACFASGLAFLAALSLAFDFGRCIYPSRTMPFFVSGRLLTGALVPFLLLYVHGLDRVLEWLTASERARWLALAAIAVAVTVSELLLARAPFASAFNLLHAGG